MVLAGGAAPLYAFVGILVGFGLIIYLLTWRSGREEALEASSYPEDEAPSSGSDVTDVCLAPSAGTASEGTAEVGSHRPE